MTTNPPPPSPPPSGATSSFPWEQPGVPLVEGFIATLKLLILSPNEAFRRMPVTGDLIKPLLFGVIVQWVGWIAYYLWDTTVHGFLWEIFPDSMAVEDIAVGAFLNVFSLFMAPVFILIEIGIGAVILHVLLMIVGGEGSGFMATLRVVCYSSVAVLAELIPGCGFVISTIWMIVLLILGVEIAHRTTRGKAALAVLLPVALCCICLGVGLWAGVFALLLGAD